MRSIITTILGVFLAGGSAFASNGTNFIGLSSESQALGGTGTANYTTTSDSLYKNPALLSQAAGDAGVVRAEAFATYFKPSPSAAGVLAGADSSAGGQVAPELAA